jgi:4-amino-4-deoxy-L-arabinose transferase-like glycosyltransferase
MAIAIAVTVGVMLNPPWLADHSRAGGLPRAAWICAIVACLSAASWSIITPPFQAPDEPAHYAYVQQLAETGRLPTSSEAISPEEAVALEALHHYDIMFNSVRRVISSIAAQRLLEHDLSQPLSRRGTGAGVAASEPPLYYALQALPYLAARGSSLLARLTLMRLLSALMAGFTAFFSYLFIREALPRAPWAWAVGGLGVALFPLLGYMSGVVNPDSMLGAVSAALFYCLARAFRRKLTPRLAVVIGAVTALGFLTKLNFVGLLPGVLVALAVLTRRATRHEGRRACRLPAMAAIGLCPAYLFLALSALAHRHVLGPATTTGAADHFDSVSGELSFIWQFYLPRLPGMARDFPGILPTRAIWFNRLIGLYGWLDTSFPAWVTNVALIPAGAIATLCLCGLARSRASLRSRTAELTVYAVLGVGVLALVGADSYLSFPARAGAYSEPRYLLPMTALFGGVLAMAARGAGRRWGPAVGALIVVLILGHDIFSQLLAISRYYS